MGGWDYRWKVSFYVLRNLSTFFSLLVFRNEFCETTFICLFVQKLDGFFLDRYVVAKKDTD